MSLNSRWYPSHPAGAACIYGMDFSPILPPGTGISAASVSIALNSVPPTPSADFTEGTPQIVGRRIYVSLQGGVSARDYRITFDASDNLGNSWPRTALLLCAATS